MKLSTSFHLQTNGQIERMNQKLEQYLQFFTDYKQKDQLEWLVMAEFAVNNKTHSTTKMFLFMTNYKREMRMRADIRTKRKVEKAIKFAECQI